MRLAEPLYPLGADLAGSWKVRGTMPRCIGKGLWDLILRGGYTTLNTCTEFEGRTLSMQHNIREAKMGVLRQEPNFLLAVAGPAIQANLWQKEAVA